MSCIYGGDVVMAVHKIYECDRCHAKMSDASGEPPLAWVNISDTRKSLGMWALCNDCRIFVMNYLNGGDDEIRGCD